MMLRCLFLLAEKRSDICSKKLQVASHIRFIMLIEVTQLKKHGVSVDITIRFVPASAILRVSMRADRKVDITGT